MNPMPFPAVPESQVQAALQPKPRRRWSPARSAIALGLLATLLPLAAFAYPPAPYHTLYGMLKDQYGTPIMSPDAQIILVASNGVTLSTQVIPGIAPGVNYQLNVTMDAGLTPIAYKPTAYAPAAPFKLFVVMGGVTNVPIQMTGNFSQLGQPTKSSQLDLTLGIDSNADGIPDAWETLILGLLGSNLTLNQINGNTSLTGDGRTLMQEYLAGGNPLATIPLTVTILSYQAGALTLQFPISTGRSYNVQASSDLKHWNNLTFTVPAEGPSGVPYHFYTATADQTLQVKTTPSVPNPQSLFFRVLQQ